MPVNDLLTPWFLLAAVLLPLIYIEKWIHSHLYGVGWLLTNDKKSATALYYVFLLPGVFLHEFVQWLIAGALNVKTKRVMAWPEAQNDGTLRLDFVQIKKANRVQAAIIGAAPLLVGLTLIWVISNHILDFENVLSALGTGDITVIGSALQELTSKTDFFLWLYLIFAISNAMLPTPADRQGWPLLIGLFLAGLVVLIVVGVGDVLVETLTDSIAHALDLLTTAFTITLLVEIPGILFIGFFEEVLERLTKRKFYYAKPAEVSKAREPGSSLPLPPGVPLPSIYNLDLPVPDPAVHSTLAAKVARPSVRTPTESVPAETSDELKPPGPRPTDRLGSEPALTDAPALTRNPVLAQRQRTPPDRQFQRPGSQPGTSLRSPLPRETDAEEDAGIKEADSSSTPPGQRPDLVPRRPESGLRAPIPISDDIENDQAEALPDSEEPRRIVPPPPLRSPMLRDEVLDDEELEEDVLEDEEEDDDDFKYIDIDDI